MDKKCLYWDTELEQHVTINQNTHTTYSLAAAPRLWSTFENWIFQSMISNDEFEAGNLP